MGQKGSLRDKELTLQLEVIPFASAVTTRAFPSGSEVGLWPELPLRRETRLKRLRIVQSEARAMVRWCGGSGNSDSSAWLSTLSNVVKPPPDVGLRGGTNDLLSHRAGISNHKSGVRFAVKARTGNFGTREAQTDSKAWGSWPPTLWPVLRSLFLASELCPSLRDATKCVSINPFSLR